MVFDGPYKLNGTPDPIIDNRYGVDVPMKWQDRIDLLELGAIECARVASRVLIVKCQDQVCSGKVRWQTRILAKAVEEHGPPGPFGRSAAWRLRDALLFPSYREQPAGRSQQHARRNYSTALVFTRG